MSMLDVVTAKGPDFAAALMNVRFPLGRTGLNGVGIFYEAGASSTSDMIVVHQHERGIEVPLVFTRNRWNTPGGFAEAGETPETTALREFAEETGHHLDIDEPTLVIHEVKQSDRSTDHGWLEANVFAVRTDTRFAVSIGENADDAKDVRWWNVSALPTLVSLGELSTQKLLYIEQSIRVLEQE
jgi:ADP-ribose pyrophosphatase YjhB (NUDIX family)